jgi:exo-beta-1,3-glucanase (GH17 family)
VHIHPWWDAWSGATITDPVQHVLDTYYDVVQQAHKPVTIGETGWPSDGEPRGLARPGLREQCLFYTEFLRAADEARIPFYYATVFDEPGRTEPGGVGSHWGLHYEDGSAKHQIQGVLWRADSKGLENPVCTPPHSTIYLPLVRKSSREASR